MNETRREERANERASERERERERKSPAVDGTKLCPADRWSN